VTGRVQGVWFRQSTAEQANRLGLQGWVRNEDDGSVRGEASGTSESLATLHQWLQRGPETARVDSVAWEPLPNPAERSPSGAFVVIR